MCKRRIKNCETVGRGKRESGLYPGSVEESKGRNSGPIKIRVNDGVFVVGEVMAGCERGSVTNRH